MSNMKPFFLTGATAKIKVNNVTLAFCTNIRYSIQINHAAPVVLGMYEASSVEPLSYKVEGSFSVVRYVADAVNRIKGTPPNGVSDSGNGVGYWVSGAGQRGPGGVLAQVQNDFKKIVKGWDFRSPDGRAYDNLNPEKLNKATTFNIEIYQKIGGETIPVAVIRDARLTFAGFDLSKRSAATQNFNFTAIYVDEDSFISSFSGNGQHFS